MARTPRAGTAPLIRETMFGHERGGDHVARASDAMERGHGIDGRKRAGQESGRPEREFDRGPGGAGGSGRESEHEKAAEPKPKTPDVDLGVYLPPSRFRPNNIGDAPRELPNPRCARPAEPSALAVLDPAAAGEAMIGQAPGGPANASATARGGNRVQRLLVSGCGISQSRQVRNSFQIHRIWKDPSVAREAFATGWYGAAIHRGATGSVVGCSRRGRRKAQSSAVSRSLRCLAGRRPAAGTMNHIEFDRGSESKRRGGCRAGPPGVQAATGEPPGIDDASEPWRVALQGGSGTLPGRADEAQRW